eukprot:TRINITY_DN40556_c0_g1_i2.p1 TRINITY_DN40556_c0_g1~~TRINITY_DN40556_c0_g1_i2.p1  ORF type:complete len:227 (-),score=51.43 TRINITY_DN40556_c0_g1_i2:8-601(-)
MLRSLVGSEMCIRDSIRAVAAFGEKLMVTLSEKGQLQGAGCSAYAHFAPGGTFNPISKDKFRPWAPFGFEPNNVEHAFANTEVVCLAAGLYHSVAVTADRKVYSWGANSEYNYGEDYADGVLLGYPTSTRAVQLHASQTDQSLWTAPAAVTVPTLIAVSYTHLTLPTKRIVEISVGAVSLKKTKSKIMYSSDKRTTK